MKTITVADGGHRFSVMLKEDADLPTLPGRDEPAHVRFLAWWREYTTRMKILSPRTAADIRVAKHLLKRYSVEELKHQAVGALLDFGGEFRNCKYESLLIVLAIKLKQAGGDLLSNGPSP